jgi:hypothetical protein
MGPKTAPIFLLGAGFSIPAGYPSHAELTGLVVEKAYEDHTRPLGVPLTGLESPCQVAALSGNSNLLEAVFVKRVFDCLVKPVGFEFFQQTLELIQNPGGRIGLTRMPCEELHQWIGLIANGRLYSDSVDNIIQDAIGQVFSQKEKADLAYVDSFVRHCEETGAHIFSTNFDTLIEDACERIHLFPRVLGTRGPARNNRKDSSLCLYKLHGSLDWHPAPNSNPESDEDYPVVYERSYQGRGIQNIDLNDRGKLIRMNLMVPHLQRLHRLYREAKSLTAIGFSFRDPHVSSIIFPPLHLDGYRLTCVTDGELPNRLKMLLAHDPSFEKKVENIQHNNLGAREFCVSL